MLTKKKIQKFEFEGPHTKIFIINWKFLAKICFYILL